MVTRCPVNTEINNLPVYDWLLLLLQRSNLNDNKSWQQPTCISKLFVARFDMNATTRDANANASPPPAVTLILIEGKASGGALKISQFAQFSNAFHEVDF